MPTLADLLRIEPSSSMARTFTSPRAPAPRVRGRRRAQGARRAAAPRRRHARARVQRVERRPEEAGSRRRASSTARSGSAESPGFAATCSGSAAPWPRSTGGCRRRYEASANLGLPPVVERWGRASPRPRAGRPGQQGLARAPRWPPWSTASTSKRPAHILTIEDPIEYVHHPKRALVNQREIHNDTVSFAAALRAAPPRGSGRGAHRRRCVTSETIEACLSHRAKRAT